MSPVVVSGRESGAEENKNQNGSLSYQSAVASDAARLVIDMPADRPCGYAFALKIE